jgi:NADPH:quinone reductase-like Zn-dependent oxidoreductase
MARFAVTPHTGHARSNRIFNCQWGSNMKAARIHRYGGPEVVVVEEIPRPAPAAGELLIRVAASGVGPWDALIREGKSNLSPAPPLTLGSDLSGVVEETGPGVSAFKTGDEIYGATNPQFCGANAQYAVAHANMVALRPSNLSHAEAASAPVIAVTAWQMLFEYGNAQPGQTVMILGAAGNVGAYAVQLAVNAGRHVIGVVGSKHIECVKALGGQTVVDYQAGKFENAVRPVDLILDTVGGETRERSYSALKPGGVLVSVVSADPIPKRPDARSVFFYVEVTTERLSRISELFYSGRLTPRIGTLLPLNGVRTAHEMLAGAPHKRGKIVLEVNG